MKLRQKLAVVMASAMVLTSVPVVTIAASTSTVSKVVTVAQDDVLSSTNAPNLKVELKNGLTTGSTFDLVLEGAEWDEDVTEVPVKLADGTEIGKANVNDKTEATVMIDSDYVVKEKDIFYISLAGIKVTDNEAKISIQAEGTEIDDKTFVFAKVNDSDAVVTAKDLKTIYTTLASGEEVGDVVITESVVGSIGKKAAADRTITIDVDHADYEFVSTSITVKGLKGFAGQSTTVSATMSSDKQTLTLELPAWTANTRGAYELEGIKVKSTDKSPAEGDLTFTVDGKNDTKVEATTVKVATVAAYGTILEVDSKATVKSGKTAKVKLTYKEVTNDSLAKSDVDFKIDKGYFTRIPADSEPIYKNSKEPKADELIGFTLTCNGTDSVTDKFLDKKEVEIATELDTEGDITLTTSGRYVQEQSVVVAEAKSAFKLSGEAMTLKVGQSKQVGGKLVITESEVGAMDKHSVITLKLTDEKGISFTELPEVTVSGNGKATDVEWVDETSKNEIKINLSKGSTTEACVVTVEGFEVKVDRTVPQGSYDLKVLVNDYKGEAEAKDFFVVGTLNTEELGVNGLVKGTSKFVIGESKYTVNGVEKTMDAQSYIQDPGFTMVPMRFVAEAFGVTGNNILFSNGVTTIFAGTRTIQLTNGSDIAVVNGAQIKMETKVVIKNGRTYAPIGEVAKLLGMTKDFDNTTKTAIFTNK